MPYEIFNRSRSVPIKMDKEALLPFLFKELRRSITIANKLTYTPFPKKSTAVANVPLPSIFDFVG
jgi:hypothetical protein